ncbi:MAG: hypothetical protein ACTS8U_01755 [Arsenophonus sp. ET-DL9-MAG3]
MLSFISITINKTQDSTGDKVKLGFILSRRCATMWYFGVIEEM